MIAKCLIFLAIAVYVGLLAYLIIVVLKTEAEIQRKYKNNTKEKQK